MFGWAWTSEIINVANESWLSVCYCTFTQQHSSSFIDSAIYVVDFPILTRMYNAKNQLKKKNNKTLTIKTQGPVFATNPRPVVYDGQPHEIRTTGARSVYTERNLAGSGHSTLLQLVPAFNCSILRWRWLIVRDNGEVAFLRTYCSKTNIGRIHYIDKRLLDSLCVGQKPPSLYIVCTENQSLQSWRSRYKTLYWKKITQL